MPYTGNAHKMSKPIKLVLIMARRKTPLRNHGCSAGNKPSSNQENIFASDKGFSSDITNTSELALGRKRDNDAHTGRSTLARGS